jgi:hypothetical protein
MADKGITADDNADPLAKIIASGKVLQRFGSATDEAIDAYEAKYATRFSAAYRNFLKRENGLQYEFSYDDAVGADLNPALIDMDTFFGIGNGDPENDLLLLTETADFYDTKLLPFAPLIGIGAEFCTYLEINQGKYAGQIMFTDGEIFSSIMEETLEGRSVDQQIDFYVITGWCTPIAASFEALLANYAQMS